MYVGLLNTIYVQIFAIFAIEPMTANLVHVKIECACEYMCILALLNCEIKLLEKF